MKRHLFEHYQKSDILTLNREQILLRLYEGLIRFLKQARNYLEQKKYDRQNHYSQKALAILTELLVSLDHSVNQDFASQLSALYTYMIRRLTEALHKKDTGIYDEMLHLVGILYDGWQDAVRSIQAPSEKAR